MMVRILLLQTFFLISDKNTESEHVQAVKCLVILFCKRTANMDPLSFIYEEYAVSKLAINERLCLIKLYTCTDDNYSRECSKRSHGQLTSRGEIWS